LVFIFDKLPKGKVMSQNKGDIFRQKLEAARARGKAEAVPMEFAGYPVKVRPLSIVSFIKAGRVPDYLTQQLIELIDDGSSAVEAGELSAKQKVEGENFKREAVCAVMVEPVIVEHGTPPEGGYLYADFVKDAPEFIEAVFGWIQRNCPMPASEKGEEVLGVEDLEKFPESGKGESSAPAGDKGKSSGPRAVRASTRASRKRTRRK
jgi:hypothetical protein